MKLRKGVATLLLASLVLLLWGSTSNCAGDKNPAATPKPRDKAWLKKHERFVAIAKKGEVDVLFLGDSITESWGNKFGQPTWTKYFQPLKAANFGISADQTQHVLWRIQNGELEGIKPKVVVLLIGTNNVPAGHKAEQIAEGITAIVKTIHEKLPESKVLLLAIFPRGPMPGNKQRQKIDQVNKIIAELDNGKTIKYLDIGPKFLKEDGTLTKTIMPDFLHLSAQGYQIWGEAIAPTVEAMVKGEKQ